MTGLLDDIVAEITAAPHSAGALTLYALVSTLEYEQPGYQFNLVKLRDLSAGQRQLAYRLMEMMVEGGNGGEPWQQAKARMDSLLRAG